MFHSLPHPSTELPAQNCIGLRCTLDPIELDSFAAMDAKCYVQCKTHLCLINCKKCNMNSGELQENFAMVKL